jgi:hypothetical protein
MPLESKENQKRLRKCYEKAKSEASSPAFFPLPQNVYSCVAFNFLFAFSMFSAAPG